MDEKIIQDILTDVFSSLEPLDAQCSAILQFLKAKGFATDKELAPFLEQAESASNVRWLAARVRIASLLSSALKPPEQPAESQSTANQTSDSTEKEPKQTAQQKEDESEPPPQSPPANQKETRPRASEQPAQQAPKN